MSSRNAKLPGLQSYRLVIAEKPDAARKIAGALGSFRSKKIGVIEYHEIDDAFDGSKYLICSAAGHLYGLSDPQKNRGIFPVLDVDWFPLSAITESRRAKFKANRVSNNSRASARIKVVSSLAERASSFVHACDLDTEGEVIGYNILKFASSKKDTKILRAKFSTLTDSDLRNAFANLEAIDESQPRAGRVRHLLDFLWGVNISRALTEAYVSANSQYRMITMGRVQGPTLALVVEREMDIETHVPIPYWGISCRLDKSGSAFEAQYRDERISKLHLAERIYLDVMRAKKASVKQLQKSTQSRPPPYPFNLGELQKEAFRIYHLSPAAVLTIAERLYLKAIVSYPRTDSQKLPLSIGYSTILRKLASNSMLGGLALDLISEIGSNPNPRQGPLDDPAHPAIYPTGENPGSNLEKLDSMIYELIFRRFLATFSRNASFQETRAEFDIGGHPFSAFGHVLTDKGWLKYYPHLRTDSSQSLPEIILGDSLLVSDTQFSARYTEKNPRFTEGSLLAKLESENIGTKATRAETISTLISREYVVRDRTIKPTETGMILIEAMKKYCPSIITPEMTREVERSIEDISKGKIGELDFLIRTGKSLSLALSQLRENAIGLGKEFSEKNSSSLGKKRAIASNATSSVVIGQCTTCKSGSLLAIRSYKTGKRFLGCSNFRNGCRTTAPLPRTGIIRPSGELCKTCSWPKISIAFSKNNDQSSWKICPNIGCPSKTR